jgi:hypothetical protein
VSFRDHHPVPVLGVPHVVVGEPVSVRLELGVVAVHVGNEEGVCGAPSAPLRRKKFRRCISF